MSPVLSSAPRWAPFATYRQESRAFALFDLLDQLRHNLENIADNPQIGKLEDRRLRILVDRNDRFRALHAGEMLDRARNNGHAWGQTLHRVLKNP